MGKQAIPGATRGQIFYIDPDQVTIIGRDTKHKEGEHPLYDERAKRDPSESRVRNIRTYGVLEAVKIRKNGKHDSGPLAGQDVLEVIDGRGRVIDCREAAKRAKKAGEDPVRLKVEFKKTDEDTQVGIMISMNELREGDTPMNRARKADRILSNGQSVANVANMFGVTRQAISQWRQLMSLSKKVQKAVDTDKLSASAALTLKKLSHDEQDAALAELIASSNGKRPTAAAVRGKVDNGYVPKLNRKLAVKVTEEEAFMESLSDDCGALIRFLAGDQKALKSVPGLGRLMKRISKG